MLCEVCHRMSHCVVANVYQIVLYCHMCDGLVQVPKDGTLWHVFAAIHKLKIATHSSLGADSPLLQGDELVAADVPVGRNSVWQIFPIDTRVSELPQDKTSLYLYQVL